MFREMSFSPSHFSRYISQTESNPDESVNVNDWAHGSPPTMSDLPCLLSFSAVPDADLSDNTILKPTAILSSVVTEDIESIPYLHHGPGPIQRPNKLNHSSATTNVSTQLKSSFQSPGTSDVLDHLNRFIYDDNEGRSSVNPSNNTNSNAVASTLVNDLTPTNMPWAYSPSEWTPKMESSWPLSTFQSPNLLSSTMENPFTMIPENSSTNSSRWSNVAVGTSPSRFVSPTNRTQHASAWNDFFSSTVPSTIANESAKLNTNPWPQYMRTADPSSPDVTTLNGHATAVNNTFWNLSSLSTDSVVPQSSQNQQGVASQIWWTGLSSDENNNTNHRNDDNSNARDQSRWDFAR